MLKDSPPLQAGKTYYTAGANDDWQRLIHFHRRISSTGKLGSWCSTETLITRQALEDLHLDRSFEHVVSVLPWLDDLSEKQNPARTQKRIDAIASALLVQDDLLSSRDATLLLNALHRKLTKPMLKLAHFRLDFWAVVLFGHQGVEYRGRQVGRWKRDRPGIAKLGRPACIDDPSYGGRNTTSEDMAHIEKAARSCAAIGRRFRDGYLSYVDSLQSTESSLVPITYSTYRYHAEKLVGVDLAAANRGNSKDRHTGGSRRQTTCMFGVEFQVDAQQLAEPPLDDDGLNRRPPLWVVLVVDTATSLVAGIGFCEGAEYSMAYRAALFTAAVPKPELFKKLFGLDLHQDDMPSIGVPAALLADRGGAPSSLDADIKTLAPTAQADRKPQVESSHAKKPKLNERVAHRQTRKRRLDLIRGEVLRASKQNRTRDISAAVPYDLRDTVELPTPSNLHRAMIERGRDISHVLQMEQAVQQFLPRRPAVIDGASVRVGSYRFVPAADSPHHLSENRSGEAVEVYIYPGSARICWLFDRGRMLELSLSASMLVPASDLTISLAELDGLVASRSAERRRLEENRNAVDIEMRRRYKETTNRQLDDTRAVDGRMPKRVRLQKDATSI